MMVIDWLVRPHLNQKVNVLFTGNAKGDSTRLTEVCTRGCTVLLSGVKACEDRACEAEGEIVHLATHVTLVCT